MTAGHRRLARAVATGSILLAMSLAPSAAGAAPANLPRQDARNPIEHHRVCDPVNVPGVASCDARIRTDSMARSARPSPATRANRVANPNVIGNGGAYDPYYLQSAYNAPSWSAGAGQTVAIVDAYDDPYAESDMNYYRSFMGLPPCTTSNGCFQKVNQFGSSTGLPAFNSGWAQEISLDLDMVSAMCPQCNILLVEARSANYGDLGTAVNTAAGLGANAISNSYGSGEWSGETAYESYYNQPGIAITVSSGDGGYGAEFPAASRYVTAVGGTSLYQNSSSGYRDGTESAWSGAGSGCSAFVPKPTWQTDAGCAQRTVADVSAVADPGTGVWVRYASNWYILGGTSAASPIVASMYALAGNASAVTSSPYSGAQWSYANTGSLNDVQSGSNGTCSPSYLCTSGPGYDGPTGNGTPNGTGAF